MPAYMRIRQYLIQKIYAGTVGDKIPSEKELCKIFGVMRPTVRVALKGLIDSGELIAKKGVGVFIARTPSQPLGKPIGIIIGDGRCASHGHLDSLLLSGILSKLPRHGFSSTFLNRSEDPEQFPNAVKALGLKEVIWIGPEYELLKLFRRDCPDIKIVAVGHCAAAARQNPPPETDIVDGYAVWDVYEEALRIGRHFFSKGMKRFIWVILKNCKDDFDGYAHGFETAAKEFGLDPKKAWKCAKYDKISPKNFKDIFSNGPVGIYSHEHFFLELDTFARDKGLVFGNDYRMLIRECRVSCQNPDVKTDISYFDYRDIGVRAAQILVSLLKGEQNTETQIKIATDILCWRANKQKGLLL